MHTQVSSLLPESLRRPSTRVRLLRPRAILLDFHGTLSERRWEDRLVFPYVRQSLVEFMKSNWNDEQVQKCIEVLRHESFEQRFRNKQDEAPLIEELEQSANSDPDPVSQAIQAAEFMLWQMGARCETAETRIISKLVWVDGFKRDKLATPIFDDVPAALAKWRDERKCPVFVISSLDEGTLRLLFEHTDKGNLATKITGFLSCPRSGEKLSSNTYKLFLERLSGILLPKPLKSILKNSNQPSIIQGTQQTQQHNHLKSTAPVSIVTLTKGQSLGQVIANPASSEPSEPKPVLFITDSGREAKAASQALSDISSNGGSIGNPFECLLISRPGNKRIRPYYLSQFRYIERFDDVHFVD